jgi:3',5'-cyclic-nucleotide phosphodiesterase
MEKVNHLDSIDSNIQPIVVLLGTPANGEIEAQPDEPPNPTSLGSSDSYGLSLVQHISTGINNSNLSKLVVPVAMMYSTESESIASHAHHKNHASRPSSGGFPVLGSKSSSPKRTHSKRPFADPQRALRCVDIGAIDVLTSPLQVDRLRGLIVHAYRACKEAARERARFLEQRKLRKRSWLGNRNDKPYAYLREAMYVPRESQSRHDWLDLKLVFVR